MSAIINSSYLFTFLFAFAFTFTSHNKYLVIKIFPVLLYYHKDFTFASITCNHIKIMLKCYKQGGGNIRQQLLVPAIAYCITLCLMQINIAKAEVPTTNGAQPTVEVCTIELKDYEDGWIATGYCSCFECCGIYSLNRPNGIVYGSSGRELIPGYSCAADLPSGTIVEILYEDGTTEERRVDDTGGAVHGKHLDLYESSHEEACKVGCSNIKVYIKRLDDGI